MTELKLRYVWVAFGAGFDQRLNLDDSADGQLPRGGGQWHKPQRGFNALQKKGRLLWSSTSFFYCCWPPTKDGVGAIGGWWHSSSKLEHIIFESMECLRLQIWSFQSVRRIFNENSWLPNNYLHLIIWWLNLRCFKAQLVRHISRVGVGRFECFDKVVWRISSIVRRPRYLKWLTDKVSCQL